MSKRPNVVTIALLSGLLLSLVLVPDLGAQGRTPIGDRLFSHLSQSVAVRYWIANPDQAPALYQRYFQRLREATEQRRAGPIPRGPVAGAFNQDIVGFPQNEETVTVCGSQRNVVLGGTNDYRGLLDSQQNFTGWHLSLDGGSSLANEGLLPPVEIAGSPVPSGGDPVKASDDNCNLYAASLNYDPLDPFGQPNGIGIYRSDPGTLAFCLGGSDPSCWPTRRAVAQSAPPHFLDKEWFDVGVSGNAGEVVWVTYSDFINDPNAPLGFVSASIQAVRCSADLADCTDPILISGDDLDVQFSDVTIGPDGRVYVTWSEIQGELEQTAQTFIHKLRIAEPGSTEFGPEQVVHVEDLAIPFGGFLHANNFRVATYPKHDVMMVDGHPRIFVVWDACTFRPQDSTCEESVIKLKYSDDDGASWSDVMVISADGDNYFPAISADPATGLLGFIWFTNRFDLRFHNQQDVEFTVYRASSLEQVFRHRVTPISNESEADPMLGGLFIGDYIELALLYGTAYIHYNANYRQTELLGEGIPIPQQDNFLTVLGPR